MEIRPNGFTLIEMLLVIIIGMMLMGFTMRAFSQVANQRAVENASDAVVMSAFRARSEAAQEGTLVYLRIRPDAGLVEVVDPEDVVLHTMDMADHGVTMMVPGFSGTELYACYSIRGYALRGCTNFDEQTIRFERGSDTAELVAMTMGQVRRPE